MDTNTRKISFEEVAFLSKKLAREATSCWPDCIVSIERGGSFIRDTIAKELNLPHYSIKLRKWYYKLPKWVPILVRFGRFSLPRPFNNIFYFLISNISRLISCLVKPMPTAGFNGEMGPEARILLVDDDVGSTGMTMKSVFNYLQAKGFKNIKTAVIRGNSQKFPVNYSVTPETPVLLFPWPWRN